MVKRHKPRKKVSGNALGKHISLILFFLSWCSEPDQHWPVQPPGRQQQHEPLQQHPCSGLLWPVRGRSPTGWQRQLAGGAAAGHQPLRFLQRQHGRRWGDTLWNTLSKMSSTNVPSDLDAIRDHFRGPFGLYAGFNGLSQCVRTAGELAKGSLRSGVWVGSERSSGLSSQTSAL